MNTEPTQSNYPFLWDDPESAPAWRKELVWKRIQAHSSQASPSRVPRPWSYWLLILMLLTIPHWQEEPISLNPVEEIPQAFQPEPGQTPEAELSPAPAAAIDSPQAGNKRPHSLPLERLPLRSPQLIKRPAPSIKLADAIVHKLPQQSPALLNEPRMQLYPQGTKITLKVPELLDLPPEPEHYWVRVFRQIRNLNTNGKIDWKDLNIVPAEDGSFVIFQYRSVPSTTQNN